MSKNKRNNRNFNESAYLNDKTYLLYFNRLSEIAMSMFEWKLPKSIDTRFLERTLFGIGSSLYFYEEDISLYDDSKGSYLALPARIGGKWNVYNVPTDRLAYATNGYSRRLTEKNSVIIYNNFNRTNSQYEVSEFARKLYEIDRAIEVNIKAQKTPILIECDENQKLSLMQIYQKYDGNQPVIYAYKGVGDRPLKAITTGAPYVADRLYEIKTNIWNEALTYLGVPNISFEKKERFVTDEVKRMQAGAVASGFGRLASRQFACEQINEMFYEGKNMASCDYRDGIDYSIESVGNTNNE